MSMLGLFGDRMNLLEAAVSFNPSPAANALLPAASIGDGDPGTMFRFGSLTADPSIYFDLDALAGVGDFEVATGGITPWTDASTGGSTVAVTTTAGEFQNGAQGAKLTCAATGVAQRYRDITVRAGSPWQVRAQLRGDGTGGRGEIAIQNLQTGRWCVGASWSTFFSTLLSSSAGAFALNTQTLRVESAEVCRNQLVTLRCYIQNSVNNKIGFVDRFELVPGVTFASVHGHNVDPLNTVKLQSADNAGSWVDRLTFSVRQPSFYGTLAAIYARYFRLLFTGTNSPASGPIGIGEAVLGDALTFARGPNYPFRRTSIGPQIRIQRRVGADATVGHGSSEQGTIPLSFRCAASQRSEFIHEVYRRSMGGAAGVIVPNTDHPEVHYGVLSAEYPEEWPAPGYVDYSTTFDEAALPLITG